MSTRCQRGVSVLLVIFLLGAVSVMGIVIAAIATTQHFSVSFSARATQGYMLARAGIDYALARVTSGAGCAGVDPALTLDGYNVTVVCNLSGTFDEGEAVPYSVFDVTATASNGSFNAPDVVNRRLRATVKFP